MRLAVLFGLCATAQAASCAGTALIQERTSKAVALPPPPPPAAEGGAGPSAVVYMPLDSEVEGSFAARTATSTTTQAPKEALCGARAKGSKPAMPHESTPGFNICNIFNGIRWKTIGFTCARRNPAAPSLLRSSPASPLACRVALEPC